MNNFVYDNSIYLEKLNVNDNIELCELFANSFRSYADDKFIDRMMKRFSDPCYASYGYKHNDMLIAAAHLYVSDTYIELERLGVLSDKQKQGIGLSLLKDLLEVLKSTEVQVVKLECRPYLSEFYKKVGFEIDEIEEHHLDSRGRDCGSIYMMKYNLKK